MKNKIILATLLGITLYARLDISYLEKVTGLKPHEIQKSIDFCNELSKKEFKGYSIYYNVLTKLIKKFNLKKGCEVGVATGNHSYHILKNTNVQILYSIDPYITYGDPTNINVDQKLHDILYFFVKDKLSEFKTRSKLLRLFSSDAVKLFKNTELDFVFLDANHTYEYVIQDLTLWYDKIRAGGIFAGDDYCTVHPGVPKAVNEFFNKKKIKIFQDEGQPRIWWIIKPFN